MFFIYSISIFTPIGIFLIFLLFKATYKLRLLTCTKQYWKFYFEKLDVTNLFAHFYLKKISFLMLKLFIKHNKNKHQKSWRWALWEKFPCCCKKCWWWGSSIGQFLLGRQKFLFLLRWTLNNIKHFYYYL